MIERYCVLGNGEGWCSNSARGLISNKKGRFINGIPLTDHFSVNVLKKCYSPKVPFVIKGILYSLFNARIIDSFNFSYLENSCLIIYDWNPLGCDEPLLKKIKKRYPKLSLVYVFTNVVRITGAAKVGYINKLKDWYDVVFAFDPEDAKKYGFLYSPLIYDADPSYQRESKESKEDLVFYVGQAKDRLPSLLSCFEKLKKIGVKTDFHIANVKEDNIRYADEIIYNELMTYEECVNSIQKATCLIDVIQGESTGLTIKTCEAVCYDKKLITTNKHVVEYPFYDSRFIKVVESPDDIDESFFRENKDVYYSKESKRYFSSDAFLERLEVILDKRENK